MSINFVRTLPSPEEIKEEFPLSKEAVELKKRQMKRFVRFLRANLINFLQLSGHALPIMKMQLLTMLHVLPKCRKKLKIK